MRRIHYTNEQVYQAVVAGKKSTRKLKKLARDWRRSLSGVNAIWYGYKKFIRDGYGYDGRKSMDGLYKRIAEGLGEDYPKVDAPQTIKKDKAEIINMEHQENPYQSLDRLMVAFTNKLAGIMAEIVHYQLVEERKNLVEKARAQVAQELITEAKKGSLASLLEKKLNGEVKV